MRFFPSYATSSGEHLLGYVDSLGINQANAFLKIMSILRERLWQLNGLQHELISISIDTTVETLYGNQQDGPKGHNTKNRGKKGYRPVLCFVDETREYLAGKLSRGETISGKEAAAFIRMIQAHLSWNERRPSLCGSFADAWRPPPPPVA